MVCGQCGREFEPWHGSQRYCGPSCGDAAKLVRDREYKRRKRQGQPEVRGPVLCAWCQTEFVPEHYNQRCCRPECQDEIKRAAARARVRETRAKKEHQPKPVKVRQKDNVPPALETVVDFAALRSPSGEAMDGAMYDPMSPRWEWSVG